MPERNPNLSQVMLLTLDVELFFGNRPGTPERCILEPLEALLNLSRETGLRLTLFVDAGYLVRLSEFQAKSQTLRRSRDELRRLLVEASDQGHDLQLHVHPHWHDATWDDDHWAFSTRYYRLHDMPESDRTAIVAQQQAELQACAKDPVIAYRAGGWCLQPFDQIRPALKAANIWIDSTVYAGGYNPDPGRYFDFRGSPRHIWRFEHDPLQPTSSGSFVEVPISHIRVSPMFFWRMTLQRLSARGSENKTFGDGSALANDRKYYLSRLTKSSVSPVSIDGAKAQLLQRSLSDHWRRREDAPFNVMGHPKAISPASISQLRNFLKTNKGQLSFSTLTGLSEDLSL